MKRMKRINTNCKYKIVVLVALLITVSYNFSIGQSKAYVEEVQLPANFKLAYLGSVIYPGIEAGFEYPLRLIDLQKTKRSGREKNIEKSRFVSTSIGWYHHKSFQDNVYSQVEYIRRRKNSNGFYTEFLPGIGISRSFVGGTVYETKGDGSINVKTVKGYNYAMVSMGGGIGYDLSKYSILPITAYTRLTVLAMFPYNSTINLRPTIEIGAHASILKVKARKYTKTKTRIK
jgi:hypothetical protein